MIVSLAVLGVGAVGMVSLRDEMVSLADGQGRQFAHRIQPFPTGHRR